MAITFVGVYVRRAGGRWGLAVRAAEGWKPRASFTIPGPGLYPRAAWKAMMEPRDPTERTFLQFDGGLLLGAEGEALVAAKDGMEVELPAHLAFPALAAALDEAEGLGLRFSGAPPEGPEAGAAAGRRAARLKALAARYLEKCEGLERRLEEAERRAARLADAVARCGGRCGGRD